MAQRLSRNAPYEIASLDIHSLNDVFRQIQQAIDELKGLSGAHTIYSEVTFEDIVTLDSSQYGGTSDLENVAATEAAGSSIKIPRADHVHAHGSGYLPNAHHNEDHQTRHNSGGADALKLDDLAAPDDNTDLNASASAHGLLRKLSGNATEYLDGSGAWSTPAGSGSGSESDELDASTTQQIWEEIQLDEQSMYTDELANGNAMKLRALQPVFAGDDLVHDLRFVTDSDGNLVYA